MKGRSFQARAEVPGEFALPCGVLLRVSDEEGITAFFGPGAPTPSRATVTREASELLGLPLWLDNWPEDDVLHHGVEWPGIAYDVIVLDHATRVREARDLQELGAILAEIVDICLHSQVGWPALGIDPSELPTFGGDRPDVPGSFFWHLGPGEPAADIPAQPLSWDVEHVLVVASRYGPLVLVPRHPASLFATPLARRSGLAPCADAEAFERLSTALAWSGSFQTIAGAALELLSARDPSGTLYDGDDARDLVVAVRGPVSRRSGELSRSRLRQVVAVSRTDALRDPQVLDSLRRLDSEASSLPP